MRAWRHLLGGLLLWAAHFMAVYGVGSIFPGTRLAIILILIVTALALAITGLLLRRAMSRCRAEADRFQRWMHSLASLGYVIGSAGIVYQGLPATLL